MIALTGVTGNLGSSVLNHLLKLIPASNIIVSVYNTEGHSKLKELGLDVRHGDYNNPETLEKAFSGAEKLFLVSSPSMNSDLRIQQHKNAIDAAKKVGVKRIYYTSLAFGGDSKADVMQAHLGTEEYLKYSGVDYTIIREGVYSEAYPVFLGFFAPGDSEVAVPGDGPVAWVSREELAEGNAKILASNDFRNETILLSGPEAITLRESTSYIAETLKQDITFRLISREEFVQRHSQKGEVPALWSSSYPAMERGETATVDPLLGKLLGKKLTTFKEIIQDLLLSTADQNEVSNWLHGATKV